MKAVDQALDRVEDLRALLADFRAANAEVPSLSSPAGAVGAVGSWTGAAADRLHADELAPMADGLDRALDRVEQAIVDELAHAVRAHRRAVDSGGDVPSGVRTVVW